METLKEKISWLKSWVQVNHISQFNTQLSWCKFSSPCISHFPVPGDSHQKITQTYSEGATNRIRSIQVILAGTANMQIISLRWTPLPKDVISLKVKNLKEKLKTKTKQNKKVSTIKSSHNLLSTPGIRMHTYAPFIEKEQSQKEDYSGFKVPRVLKEILNLGVEMNNLGFWEAKWIQSFLVNWHNVSTHKWHFYSCDRK